MGFRIGRFDVDRPPQQSPRLLILSAANAVDQADRTDDEAPGVDAVGRMVGGTDALLRVEVGLDGSDNVAGDLILHGEDVAQLAVVPLGPDMLASRGVDELTGDTNSPAGSPDAALEDVTDAEFLGDPADVHGSSLVGEGRVARDDEEPAQAGQCRDDVLGDPVREVVLLRIATHVGERQDGDRWGVGDLRGSRRRRVEGRCRRLRRAQLQPGVAFDNGERAIREKPDKQLIYGGFAELGFECELLARYPLASEVIPNDGCDPLPVVHPFPPSAAGGTASLREVVKSSKKGSRRCRVTAGRPPTPRRIPPRCPCSCSPSAAPSRRCR